ncbi:carbohydrate-binding module family 1 protein [Macroventuria anomochaeta]|uniref:Carbohydrate-binding module family 1 protein n=1 Tax=Macroventuria anomochaeta TaxID=301207 RepID=A0ACB6RYR4_9PLEO|nr:carbohydrate-binding module family 1 protein [Macroventuria anomochaeta]KAF2627120.1 carbohydrate-binding module family 1 protein [Macroventuria anomochaeta]
MKFSQVQLAAFVASLASAQTLNIPTRVGEITSLPEPSVITGSEDFGNKEFDRGHPCDSDEDTGSDNAVFVLEDGASLSNVIIGADSLEGVHCLGACTLTNVWFRDVCEDAISVLGTGDATIIGGGAQEAKDKVVQHNGAGTVTIKDFTVVNAGKLYRSCGDCTNNESKSPRKVIVENIRAYGMTSDLIGINSNFGDEATISGSCGETKNVCQEYKGVNKGSGSSSKVDTKTSCKGAQGLLETLPACGAGDELPETEVPSETASETTVSATATPVETAEEETPSATTAPTETEEAPEETTTPTPTESESAPEEEAPVTTAAPDPSTLLTLTKTAEDSTPTEDSSSGSVARWGQCGGKGYTGPTACAAGECKVQNDWYSQCL